MPVIPSRKGAIPWFFRMGDLLGLLLFFPKSSLLEMIDFSGSKEEERVVVLQTKGQGVTTFRKVEVAYADSSPCYHGWIQVFGDGDGRNGPTVFPQNYVNHNLDRERVFKLKKFWETPELGISNTGIREAVLGDLDEIIDLRFQGLFDDVYDRISAYQGLTHKIDSDHLTLVYMVDGVIYGLVYFDLKVNADRCEAYFDSWFCAPGIRGRGVGTALVKAGLEKIKELGFKRVSAGVLGSEDHCLHNAGILKSCGFSVDDCYENVPGILQVDMSMAL